MAKDLSAAPGIVSDTDFPDDVKIVDGFTTVGEHINQDIIQFFQKLMKLAFKTPNGNYDNEVNGYQFIDALNTNIMNTVNLQTAGITRKAMNIGTWNMTTTENKAVVHGLTSFECANIYSVKAMIISDGLTYGLKPLDSLGQGLILAGGVDNISTTNVNLFRDAAGEFGALGRFQSTAQNRGFILIEYLKEP